MAWFLVKTRFVMDDGVVLTQRGWYEAKDFIDAAELARLDRQWDLRPYMRAGEFINPEKVVSAEVSAKRYRVKKLVSFDVPADKSEITNKVYQ